MKQYERSDYSQWGEDGVIEEIFRRIGETNRLCIEIGAWNGIHFSNTKSLRDKGWKSILAESDALRLHELNRLAGENCKVFGHVYDIDSMLSMYEAPESPDLLSIDVDGDDYYLWEAMVKYTPRVVVIEYNNTVPMWVEVRGKRGGSFGASAWAINKMARAKGYYCVHCTITNMIFVQDRCLAEGAPPVRVNPSTDHLQYIVTGYNGKQYIIGTPAHNDNQNGQHEELLTDITYQPLRLAE